MALTTASGRGVSEKITATRSAAKLTAADVTPGTARIVFSIRLTQEAQDMPPIRILTAVVPVSAAGAATRSLVPAIVIAVAPRHSTASVCRPSSDSKVHGGS